ncbi:polysaccharide deacetylase family protein [Clostridium lacusfryxellense]|uniref:polysaccharide deacetylase family protein n=1 Tax=Clostridium lacusfryxellense TaxID=205328 RepID=UPI001C0D3E6F|nr:polysaccharide deacetylase family protein [Clostridium lacusfryxellense]MBU3112316.1 polysaccharide deacetylase [Clostridium lacusfryxellense]
MTAFYIGDDNITKYGQAAKKKRIKRRNVKIKLLSIFIFLILIGTIIIGKCLTKEEEVKAEPVTIPTTTTTIINDVLQTNNEISKGSTKNHAVSEECKKYTYNAEKVSAIVNYKEKNDGQKIAFLTFDDGPSTTVTPKILDVLKDYNVKATFFLIGKNIVQNEKSKGLVKREFNEGHAIGNHTYSHKWNMLFPNNKINVPTFMDDVKKNDNVLKTVLGQDFNTRILRVPGGYVSRIYYKDPNLPELDVILKEKNMISVDWNVEIRDAAGKPNKSSDELFTILKKQVGTKSKVIILMHDTYGKIQTANALPQIIEYLKYQGYEFRTIK